MPCNELVEVWHYAFDVVDVAACHGPQQHRLSNHQLKDVPLVIPTYKQFNIFLNKLYPGARTRSNLIYTDYVLYYKIQHKKENTKGDHLKEIDHVLNLLTMAGTMIQQ